MASPAASERRPFVYLLNTEGGLLGAQRADVGSTRAIWVAQDKLALDADEEKANELEHELVSGQERTVWNLSLSIPAKEFEFTDAEVVRVKAAIETWDAYGAAADRRWLEPLLNALAPSQTRDLRSRSSRPLRTGVKGASCQL